MVIREPVAKLVSRPRAAAVLLGLARIAAPAPAQPARLAAGPTGAAHGPAPASTLFLPLVMKQHLLEKLAFESDRDGNAEIYVIQSDGSNQTRLTFNPADDFAPAWSPDGARITFTSKRDGGFTVYVMNADGSNPLALTSATKTDSWSSWSPDGQHIVFQSYRDGGGSEIYVMNPDGSNQTRLTNSPAIKEQPKYSPDGSKILYSYLSTDFFNHTPQGEIYVMDATGANQTRLTFDQANDFYANWSGDGSHIVFFSQRAPGGVFVMQANGSNVTHLLNGDEPDWSADSQRVAYVTSDGINIANADGSNAVLISDHHMNLDSWPRWHP